MVRNAECLLGQLRFDGAHPHHRRQILLVHDLHAAVGVAHDVYFEVRIAHPARQKLDRRLHVEQLADQSTISAKVRSPQYPATLDDFDHAVIASFDPIPQAVVPPACPECAADGQLPIVPTLDDACGDLRCLPRLHVLERDNGPHVEAGHTSTVAGVSQPAREYALETWMIHADIDPTGALVPPIYPAVGYVRPRLDEPGEFMYSRRDNPTRQALEHVLARLHGAQRAVAFGSGMAAVTAVGQLLPASSHVLLPDDVYGNTHRLYTLILPEQQIEVDFVDYTNLEAARSKLRPTTRLLWIETPTNPTQNIVDLSAVTELGHAHGALVAVDNSWLSPYFQQPLAFGVDLVVESTTKYLNGHDDVLGGAVLTNVAQLGERLAFLQYVGGAVPSPFDCWLLLRGLKTLAVRMERHQRNALAVATFLTQHPCVERVHYPGLPNHPGQDIIRRQMRGPGGMVSFEVRGDREAARRVAEATRLFRLASGFGGVESLVAHPLTMTHASQVGLEIAPSERLLRLSVGLEAEADLLDDLDQALSVADQA